MGVSQTTLALSDAFDRPRAAGSPKVLIVVLNYRTSDLAIRALTSLEAEASALGAHVVMVDGGSKDGSAERLGRAIEKNGWSRWCDLLALPENRGFAAGNNAALRPALASSSPPDYVWLVNPDTEVRPGAGAALLAHLEARPEVGIAGSRLEDPDGTPQISAFRFPTPTRELVEGLGLGAVERLAPESTVRMPVPETVTAVDWVAGASMMVRREVFERVGLLDEGYFLYFEETDFCWFAERAGWRCEYVPHSRVVHLVGRSTGVTEHRDARGPLPKYWFESRERYFRKTQGRTAPVLASLALGLGAGSRKLRRKVLRQTDNQPPRLVRSLLRDALLPRFEPPRRAHGPSRGGRPPVAERGRFNENPSDIGFLPLLLEDFQTHERRLLDPGWWAVSLHRTGNQIRSLGFVPVRAPLAYAHSTATRITEILTGIELPYSVRLGRRVRIWHHGGVVLHAESIGDDVHIRHNTTFGVVRTDDNEGLPIIGSGVDIGVGSTVLGSVRVGDGAVIGAHALVLHDVEPGHVVVGSPARPVGRTPMRAAPWKAVG